MPLHMLVQPNGAPAESGGGQKVQVWEDLPPATFPTAGSGIEATIVGQPTMAAATANPS